MAPRHSRTSHAASVEGVRKAPGAPRPNLKQTLRPSGKAETAHAPLKEAVQAAKNQLTITPFIGT
jgi:hypothetical protein